MKKQANDNPGKDVSTPKSEAYFTTASKHYANRLRSVERIFTGSKNLDDLLCGGVETKAVTEFYGAPSSGKTQICHTLCTMVPQDKSRGGVCGKSIYIDTEGTFRPERIASIAKSRGFDPDMTLKASDFTIHVSGNHQSPDTFPGSETGTDVTLGFGSYQVTEVIPGAGSGLSNLNSYGAQFSTDCSGVMHPGETKTCTITNVFQPIG